MSGKYAVTTFKPQVPLHRYVMGQPAGLDVDHRDGNRMDCRKNNLRVVTRTTNLRNKNTARTPSGFIGVYRYRGRWRAAIQGQHIGVFDTPLEAHTARLRKELELWGIQPRRLPAFQAAGLA